MVQCARTFPPLPLPVSADSEHRQDLRDLFPEEVERRKVDEKYQVEQVHVMCESESVDWCLGGRAKEEFGRFSGDEADNEVAWKVALREFEKSTEDECEKCRVGSETGKAFRSSPHTMTL